jgi:predicted SprT family Zn-dependent metalloprotease
MNLGEAQVLAKEMINKYVPEYGFAWINHKRVNGRCSYRTKTIELSRPLTELRTKEAVRQTIMHEIAHAMWPKEGHRGMWRVQMRRFGYEPERCSSDDVDKSSISNWKALCVSCGKAYFMIRKPRQRKACGVCCNGKFNTKYELTYKPI